MQRQNTILFKFRNHAESALPSSISLPSLYPRIFDIKKAIVKASGLDRGKTSDFDLIIRNAMTGESYDDELMRLGLGQQEEAWRNGQQQDIQMRGKAERRTSINLTVERIPAARGQGLLVRIARADVGLDFTATVKYGNLDAASRGFYDYRIKDGDEFVYDDVCPKKEAVPMTTAKCSDEGTGDHSVNSSTKNKISKGIDHLGVAAPRSVDNRISSNGLSLRHKCERNSEIKPTLTLESALQICATNVPYYYQCGICAGVAKDALFIPWDDEGRTACDYCMRKALCDNWFCCPLTGNTIDPNSLRPNKPLRRAIKQFVMDVMKKAEVVNQLGEADTKVGDEGSILGKGVVIGKEDSKGQDPEDVPNSLDDFGGDVFCVCDDGKEGDKCVDKQAITKIGEKGSVDINNANSKSVTEDVNENNKLIRNSPVKRYFDSSSRLLPSKRGIDATSKLPERSRRVRTRTSGSYDGGHFYKEKFIPCHP